MNTQRVLFVTGLASNHVLNTHKSVEELIQKTTAEFALFKKPVKRYCEFYYKAGSWILTERVVAKVEFTEKGELNIRFIVSNIKSVDAKSLYETTYCKRGKDELYIRQFKEAVHGDRLSCHTFRANRLRIFIYLFSCVYLAACNKRACFERNIPGKCYTTDYTRTTAALRCKRKGVENKDYH